MVGVKDNVLPDVKVETFYAHVDILGSEYKMYLGDGDTYPLLKEMDGYTDTSIKTIVVHNCATTEPDSKQNLAEYRRSVMRHEIIHAFLHESGLGCNANGTECWSTNEEMVDWMAIQFPKILKAFREVNCL